MLAGANTSKAELLSKCLIKATKIVRTWGKTKAVHKRAKEDELRNNYSRAQCALQIDPQSEVLQEDMHRGLKR